MNIEINEWMIESICLVTNSASAGWAGRLLAAVICKRITMDVIQVKKNTIVVVVVQQILVYKF